MRVCACSLQMIADRVWTGIHCRNILFTFRAIPSKGVTAILCKARLYVARSASLALNSAAMRSWMITITRNCGCTTTCISRVTADPLWAGSTVRGILTPHASRCQFDSEYACGYVFGTCFSNYWLYFASDLEGTTWQGFKGDRKLWWPWYNVGLLHNPPF